MDYLPFDYMRYAEEILPLWREALQGNIEPLKNLIETATHFSLWPYMRCSLSPSPNEVERIRNSIAYSSSRLERFLSLQPKITHLWKLFAPVIQQMEQRPTLTSRWEITAVLHSALVYTFCSDLPTQDESALSRESDRNETPHLHYAPRIGNEDIPLWEEYTCRDELTKYLWKQFYQPLPADVPSDIVAGQMYTAETRKRNPRALFAYFRYANPSGFLTSGETKRLLQEYRRHEAPLLHDILESCLRDAATQELTFDWLDVKRAEHSFPPAGVLTMDLHDSLYTWDREAINLLYEAVRKAHPAQMQQFAQKYYERVWRLEEEMMERVAYAVSQNWGFMVIYE